MEATSQHPCTAGQDRRNVLHLATHQIQKLRLDNACLVKFAYPAGACGFLFLPSKRAPQLLGYAENEIKDASHSHSSEGEPINVLGIADRNPYFQYNQAEGRKTDIANVV